MAIAHITPPQFQQLAPIQSPQFYKMAEQITQMAIRILFVASSILMAAYAAPLTIHTLVVSNVAIGASVLSGFFFPQPMRFLGSFISSSQPIQGPLLGQGAIQMPEGAPRGLMNAGTNNCFLNSLVHFFEGDPQLAAWLRTPLNNLEGLIDFMNDYPQPPNFMNQFRAYIAQRQAQAQAAAFEQAALRDLPAPIQIRMPPVVNLFRDFLNQYEVDPQHLRVFNSFVDSFDAVYKIQLPFSRFLREYDEAIRDNLPISEGNSNALRRALIDFKPWLPPGNTQMDASEIMGYILEALPPRMHVQIEVSKNLSNPYGAGKAPRNDPPIVKLENKIDLSIPEGNGPISLADVFNAWHLDREEHEPVKRIGEDGVERNYPIESTSNQFLAPPPALRISLKRFGAPPVSWLTSVCAFFWPALQYAKRSTPIDVPDFITIQTKDGQRHQYRLVSFATHLGASKDCGHYVSGEIKNGNKYLESDERVTHVQTDAHQLEWEEQLKGAYLLNYVPVPPVRPPVQQQIGG